VSSPPVSLPQVQTALHDVMREHAVLVVAHRLSTVERADNIVVIDRGRVAEQGSHAQLMASGGLYCKLVQRQVLGIETGAELLNPAEGVGGRPRRRQSSSSSAGGGGGDPEGNMRY